MLKYNYQYIYTGGLIVIIIMIIIVIVVVVPLLTDIVNQKPLWNMNISYP